MSTIKRKTTSKSSKVPKVKTVEEVARKFKIYDELKEDLKTSPVKDIDKRRLCSIIAQVNIEHREIIYALILHHRKMEASNAKTWNINPYKGKTFDGGKGVRYNWDNLPVELQNIIIKYIEKISEM